MDGFNVHLYSALTDKSHPRWIVSVLHILFTEAIFRPFFSLGMLNKKMMLIGWSDVQRWSDGMPEEYCVAFCQGGCEDFWPGLCVCVVCVCVWVVSFFSICHVFSLPFSLPLLSNTFRTPWLELFVMCHFAVHLFHCSVHPTGFQSNSVYLTRLLQSHSKYVNTTSHNIWTNWSKTMQLLDNYDLLIKTCWQFRILRQIPLLVLFVYLRLQSGIVYRL